MSLTTAQFAALDHIRDCAKARKDMALETIRHILKMTNVRIEDFEEAVTTLKTHGRVALHFHPDRLDPNGKMVAQTMLEQGVYKSQFETKLSNGSVSAYPKGARDLWEKQLYGGAYHVREFDPAQRPKYGALDVMRHPDGPAPRFGSCYFLLKPLVSQRCTFTYLDSHRNPDEKGTLDEFDDILAAALTDVFTRNFALGVNGLSVSEFVNRRLTRLSAPLADPFGRAPARDLDFYIEAQVHGEIAFQDDIERLVCDPCFRGTRIGEVLEQISRRYGIGLFWHAGFTLELEQVPDNFRGPSMPSLAKSIATKSYFDASMIGVSAAALVRNPTFFDDRGSPFSGSARA